MKREPNLIPALWGIWLPDGGPDRLGGWMFHGSGAFDGPEAYASRAEAEGAADYYMTDFDDCCAAPLTPAAVEADCAGKPASGLPDDFVDQDHDGQG